MSISSLPYPIHVPGGTTISIGGTDIGSTDAQDFVSIEIENPMLEIHTDFSGPDMVAKVINLGRQAIIRIPFQNWVEGDLQAVLLRNSDGTYNTTGSIGVDLSTFPLVITPTISGETGYSFDNCYLIGNETITGWGNVDEKHLVVFKAIADPGNYPDDSELYTTFTV